MSTPTATVIDRHPGATVIHILSNKLDETNISAVRTEVVDAGTAAPELPVVLDMGNVNFVPSLSLGGLIQLVQVFKSRGQRLVLANLQLPVRQVLVITRIDRLFEIQNDLSAFTGKPGAAT